jgi:transcriptional regulator with XRE-family HTH domain
MALRQRLVPFGLAARRVRQRVGQTQAELGRRVRKSQSWVSLVESGTLVSLTVADADAVCRALGATLVFTVETPLFIGRDRQRDLAHAKCLAFVARRLTRAGWQVEREVQIERVRLLHKSGGKSGTWDRPAEEPA